MRLWRYCYWEFLGPYLQTQRAEDGAVERVRELCKSLKEKERETFILRSAQLLRGTGDYR